MRTWSTKQIKEIVERSGRRSFHHSVRDRTICPIHASQNQKRTQRSSLQPSLSSSRTINRMVSMHSTQPLNTTHDTNIQHSSSLSSIPTIELTSSEQSICQLLDDTCHWIEEYQPQPDPTRSQDAKVEYTEGWTCEARIAGGWVRDKLLGQQSHDLDISLSSLTGYIFALLLESYLRSPQFAQSELARNPNSLFHLNSSQTDQLVGHITKIAANPEQSKNLETATAIVAGLSLDFVNLRKEVYVGNSRIPIMTFGTALEDAQRRDITINSLFFNVHTKSIEDLTGLGISDLRDRIIRTPLQPQQTFLDDPLRVLRCIRFANRFDYKVNEEIFDCIAGDQGTEIRNALMSKVSRERFGIEIDKMMLGPDPAGAMKLIEKMGLYDIVFGPPPGDTIRASKMDHVEVQRAILLLEILQAKRIKGESVSDQFQLPFPNQIPFKGEVQRLLYYSAALLPLQNAEWEEKKGKWQWAGACIILRGLKLGVRTTKEPLACLWKSAELLHRPIPEIFDAESDVYRGKAIYSLGNNSISPRSTRALLVRHPESHKTDLGMTIELRLLWTLVSDLAADESLWSSTSMTEFEKASLALRSSIVETYSQFYQQLQQENVLSRIEEKVLLDGKEIMDVLDIKPGALISIITKQVEAWQFDRNLDSEFLDDAKAECKEWLRSEWEKGGIVPFNKRGGEKEKKVVTKKKQK